MRLRIDGVSVMFGDRRVVSEVSIDASDGQFVALLGPNGSGKSTLLRTVYRALEPAGGAIWLGDEDLWQLDRRAVGRAVGVLGQEHHAGFDFTVSETVMLGRTPHFGMLDRANDEDRDVVARAMEQTEVAALAERPLATLSGGERQRVLLARALAQQPRVLILDEPTNHLDPRHRHELLALVRGLGVTVVAAQHDLDLAAAYSDAVVILRAGSVVAAGTPAEVLTPALIHEVYGLDAEISIDADGRPRIHLVALRRPA